MEEKETNNRGRPLKYKNAEELQKKIDEYFDSCYRPVIIFNKEKCINETIRDEEGNVIKEQYRPFTITGLADALDMSRQDLINYSNREEFFDTVTRAKRKCEIYAEERLYDRDGNKGAIFSLSNNFKNWNSQKQDDEDSLEKVKDILVTIKEVANGK